MAKDKAAKEAANQAANQATGEIPDRGESIGLMEPLLISEGAGQRAELGDRALILAQKATGLRGALPDGLLASLATLVRSMNCYQTFCSGSRRPMAGSPRASSPVPGVIVM